MTRPGFTQRQFDNALAAMLRKRSRSDATHCRVVARDLHRSVVGGSAPNRMPMACNAMWKLARSLEHTVLRRTASGRSSSLEIEYRLDSAADAPALPASAPASAAETTPAAAPRRPSRPSRGSRSQSMRAEARLPDVDLYLVACVKRKRDARMPARDLYASPWFRKARACVERTGRPWAILSARHGLVWPDETVAPYDEALGAVPAAHRHRWADGVFAALAPHLDGVRTVAVLAGRGYRELLLPKLQERGIEVRVPMEGLTQGRQLNWLHRCLSRAADERRCPPAAPPSAAVRIEHLQRFYECLARLGGRLGGARRVSECSGAMPWPRRGVYFFTEPGEPRSDSGCGSRIVRVGTHGLTQESESTLWTRLAQHRGTGAGGGYHRVSIFRLLVGTALMAKDGFVCQSWGGRSQRAPRGEARAVEKTLEAAVSAEIGRMSLLWLPVDDEPGPDSLRGYVERNAIALLSNSGKPPVDAPSNAWLGRLCDREKVRASGLWNSRHVDEAYDPAFLEAMERLVRRACDAR